MSAVGAQELMTSQDCKVPNCHGEAVPARGGPFKGLCEHHKRIKVEEQRQAVLAGFAAKKARGDNVDGAALRPAGGSKPGDLSRAARAVVPAAQALEKKLDRRRHATSEAKAALAAFNEALNELKVVAEAALNGGQAS